MNTEPRKSVLLACVPLPLSAGDADDKPRWIQLAYVGQWCGHPAGPFKFTREVFGDLVRNFRNHPQFQLGGDGYGTAPVVAYDFDHASEMPPTQRAALGAPAQGWLLDLETRQGRGGRLELFGLSDVLEPAKGYIKGRKLRWVSVAVHLHATDHVTDAPIGAVISSVAFTNQPFLRALEPLAASALGATRDRTEQVMTIETEHKALLSALRVTSTADAAARVPVLLAAESEIGALQKENADLKAKIQVIESEKIEGEVASAMATLDLHASMKDALVLCRTHEPAKFTAMVETMKAAGKGVAPERARALTAPLGRAATGSALDMATIGPDGRVTLSAGAQGGASAGRVDIRGVVGPTRLARVICAVQQRNPQLSYEEAAETSLAALHTGAVLDG